MRKLILLSLGAVMLSSCATMNESLKLGAALGSVTGAAATMAGEAAAGRPSSFGTVAVGASIGTAIGLLTSYFTEKQLARDRAINVSTRPRMYFGDLPPSPFIVPKMHLKKGGF